MLKELETKLNGYWKDSRDIGSEYYRFIVRQISSNSEYVAVICLNDDNTLKWMLSPVKYSDNMAALITDIIKEFYEMFYNPQNKIVKSWKGYINRKCNSLQKAMQNNDDDKVAKINFDMIERYRAMNNAKFEISEYKKFISMFYNIKAEYEQPVSEVM